MAEQQTHNQVAFLARLAGITVPHDRLEALATGLVAMQGLCDSLARFDYGARLPAGRFEAPGSR